MDTHEHALGFPLSAHQQHLWRTQAAGLCSRAVAEWRIKGPLNAESLRQALRQVVLRHEILRMQWPAAPDASSPWQVVDDRAEPGWTFVDLRGSTEVSQGRQLDLAFDAAASLPSTAPGVHVWLGTLADDEHALILSLPALAADGPTLHIVADELLQGYRDDAFTDAGEPVQYLQYVEWQQDLLSREEEQPSALAHEAAAPAALRLPYEVPAPAEVRFEPAHRLTPINADLAQAIFALADRLAVSPAALLLANWGLLLSRLCVHPVISVGHAVDGRSHDELRGMPGPYTRCLPVAVDLRDDYSFIELATRTGASIAAAEVNQHGCLAMAFPFAFQFETRPVPQHACLALRRQRICAEPHTVRLDCILTGRSLSLGFGFDAARLNATAIERLQEQYLTLLTNVLLTPDRACRNLSMLGPSERHALIVAYNDTAYDYDDSACAHHLFEQQAERTPHASAAVCRGERLSYAELNLRAERLAAILRMAGIGPECIVGIALDRTLHLPVALLAVLKAGAAYLPLDPGLPAARLSFMLGEAGAKVLLTQQSLLAALEPVSDGLHLICLDRAGDAVVPDLAPTAPARHPVPHDLAYVIFTSGSTGQPKGVMVTHYGLVNYLHWCRLAYPLHPGAEVPVHSPVSFDLTVTSLLAPLTAGCTVHLLPEADGVQALARTLSTCAEVGLVKITPAHLQLLASQLPVGPGGAVRALVVGGENLLPEHIAGWQRAAPDTRIFNEYGPTETVVGCCVLEVGGRPTPSAAFPIGNPIINTRLYVLDEQMQPVATGIVGELYIGGRGVARGYLNRPDLTAERFVDDPFGGAASPRMYRTGDLARHLPDGGIEILGRLDHQMKIRGYRIEAGEIEAALMAQPGVTAAVALTIGTAASERQLVTYVAADLVAAAGLRTALQQILPDYMVPSRIIRLDALPLTTNGKVDRQALPAPDEAETMRRPYAAPQGEAEQVLAAVWQELFGLEQVGRNDHFFELGGHSFLLISLVQRMRGVGYTVDLPAAFAAPVLSDLATRLKHAGPAPSAAIAIPAGSTRISPSMVPLAGLSQDELDHLVTSIPAGAAGIQDLYALSPLQQGILFHHQLHAEGDPYIAREVLACDDRGRVHALLAALQAVIDRHDILRTAFFWDGLPHAVQVVARHAPLSVETLATGPGEEALTRLLAHTDPTRLRLDLREPPLIRAYLVQDSPSGPWLVALLFHHLVCDHASMELIIGELQTSLRGGGRPLPPALPFRSFIASLAATPIETHESYFRDRLGDFSTPTIPFGVSASDCAAPAQELLTLDTVLAQRLRAGARRHGVSPAVLFHAAWAQVLGACCGSDDVVFGTVLSGRMQGQQEDSPVVGMFLNTLPLRVQLGGLDQTAQVAQVNRRLGELLRHEQASLVLVQRCSGVPVHTPLFSSLLNYRFNHDHGADGDAEAQQAWQGIRHVTGEERSSYPVTLVVDDWGTFHCKMQCTAGLDPKRMLAYLQAALEHLADALEAAPDHAPKRCSLLPPAERQRLLVDFNATTASYPEDGLIQQIFAARAAAMPDATALVCGDERLSYGELNRRANRLAHHLIGMGVRPDDRVALYFERGIDMVVAMLGTLKAGAAYVPLDTAAPEPRLRAILDECAPVALLTAEALQDDLPALSLLRVLVLDDPRGEAAMRIARLPEHDPAPASMHARRLAYVIYTSGSTGAPKGVMVEHRNVLRLVINSGYAPITTDDCVVHCSNPAFDASTWEIWSALLNGARLLLVPAATVTDAARFCAVLLEAQASALWLTAALLNEYVDALAPALGRLRYLLAGGDVLDPRTAARLLASEHAPGRLINGYGPTETTTFACTYAVTHCDGSQPVPIGRPIGNTTAYILDAHLQPVPLGAPGELYIGGDGVARGYLNRPELTTERFLPDPFSAEPGARMYKTGDLARFRSDGNIEYLGRNDFQVKIRGFRVEPGEIEARLAGCDGVREAIVLARGEGADKQLVAYLLANDPANAPAPGELRSALAASLPDYMVPAAFIVLDAFPLTPNGKLDRNALPALEQSSVAVRTYTAPQGETETLLAGLWQDLLHLPQVGRDDHFFELGGHSLMAVRLASQLRLACGAELPLREMFAHPTLAEMARAVRVAAAHTLPPIAPASREQVLPLSWAQQRLWFLDQFDHAAAYHMPAGLRLRGALNRSALIAALDRMVERHENLRTTFTRKSGQAVQTIAPPDVGFALAQFDLASLPDHERESAVERISQDEAAAPFDLAAGPLIRGRLLRLADDEHVLLVTQHHIISDGWSNGVLMREFSALYAAFSQGLPDPLPPLSIQYADYAVWQRQWLQGEPLQRQLAYWEQHLAGAPALLKLPTDRPRPARQSRAGGSVAFVLPPDLTDGLRALGRRHGATLFMTMLTGWAALLSRLSGQHDIVIGTPVANRQRTELEPLTGFFVNTLALRLRLEDDPDVAALLAQARDCALAAYAQQDVPFEQVVEALKPPRSLSYNPVFQTMLGLNNTTTGEVEALPGLTLEPVRAPQLTTPADVALPLMEHGDTIVGALEFASDLFDPATAERWVGHFQTLLSAMVADQRMPVSRLPLLGPEQRRQLLEDFNGSVADDPRDVLVHQLFEAQAAQRPDAIALVGSDERISYGELNRRANRLAHHLMALGAGPDQRVAICAERGVGMVSGLLAILKAGAAYVPLDPASPPARLANMLEDSAPVALLAANVNMLPSLPAGIPIVDLEAIPQGLPEHNPDPVALGLQPHHLAYVIYTSGSTGTPKGVMIEHRNVANLVTDTSCIRVAPDDRVAHCANPAFDASAWEIWATLANGAGLVIVPQAVLLDPVALSNLLEQHCVTVLHLTAGLFAQHASACGAAFARLQYLLFGGQETDPGVVRAVLQHSAPAHLVHCYGPTETTTFATSVEVHSLDSGERLSVGRPLDHKRAYILDAHLQPVPVGVAGELFISGAGVARGYLNRPELTAERFLPDPFSTHPTARMYKTGDLARYRPNGSIEYLGRNDFQVKIRGFRIEPGEIETRLSACDNVREAVVMAREDHPGEQRLVAYVVSDAALSTPSHVLEHAWRGELASILPDYMIPAAFVVLDALPLTPNGKLDRAALPKPEAAAIDMDADEPPLTETEAILAKVWQGLLDLPSIGRHADFFELGGDSLMVIAMVDRLHVLGRPVPVQAVFATPTLAGMADAIDTLRRAADKSTAPLTDEAGLDTVEFRL